METVKGYAYAVFNGAKGYVSRGKVVQDMHSTHNADVITFNEFSVLKAAYEDNPYKTLHFEPIKN